MGSKNPPVNLYDPAMLATVEQAFDSTWVVLQTRYPFRDFKGIPNSKLPSVEALDARCGGRDRSS